MQNELEWLQTWYKLLCDGDWEHQKNIRFSTIDNPGWLVSINLIGTPLEILNFDPIKIDKSDHDWIDCWVENNQFEGRGGVENLVEILRVFQAWVQNNK